MNKILIPKQKNCILDEISKLLINHNLEKTFNVESHVMLEDILLRTPHCIFLAIHYSKRENKLLLIDPALEELSKELINMNNFIFGFICNGDHFLKEYSHLSYISYNNFIPIINGHQDVNKSLLFFFDSIFNTIDRYNELDIQDIFQVVKDNHNKLVQFFKAKGKFSEAIFFKKWKNRLVYYEP
ncbi:MAG: hypothetical protein MI974_10075 [Chitinophagales bacterium]|nr:hypothetical protein [Chitinophagales bacterium]